MLFCYSSSVPDKFWLRHRRHYVDGERRLNSLSEALTMLADMNPKWKVKAFMIDASEIVMYAIFQTFTGKKTTE